MNRIGRGPLAWVAVSASLAALGCGGGSSGKQVPVPATLVRVAGADQTGVVGSALAREVVVRAADAGGAPVEGLVVRFGLPRPGGAIPVGEVRTDAAGEAAWTWTLGPVAGAQSLTAEALHPGTGAPILSVGFDALALPGPAATVAVEEGDGQHGAPATLLPGLVVVKVTDRFGNAIQGAEVAFAPGGGSGALEPETATTDPTGLAWSAWTLGFAWQQQVVATVAGMAGQATFTATRLPGNVAVDLVIVAGDGQVGPVAEPLPGQVRVRVMMQGTPVPGVRVDFAPALGGGTADPASVVTAPDGTAGTIWSPGQVVGSNVLAADVADADLGAIARRAVLVTATATPGPPAALAVTAGDGGTGYEGVHAYVTASVRASDRFGNAAPGAQVTFAAIQGSGLATPTAATADGAGVASVRWEYGRTIGEEVLEASLAVGARVQLRATVGPALGPYDGTYWAGFCGSPLTVVNGIVGGVGPEWWVSGTLVIDASGLASWTANRNPPGEYPSYTSCTGTFVADGAGGVTLTGTLRHFQGPPASAFSAVRAF